MRNFKATMALGCALAIAGVAPAAAYSPPTGSISTATSHSCAVLEDGAVSCWGGNAYGQATVPSFDGKQAVQIDTGPFNTCAALRDGSVKCWGLSTSNRTAVPDFGTSKAIQVSVGIVHACALLDDGSVTCWGGGAPTIGDFAGRKAVQIASGHSHVCARFDDGTVGCWGDDSSGQSAVPDLGGRKAVDVAAGTNGSCAALEDGVAVCWGAGSYGQTAVPDFSPRKATQVAVGNRHACAVLDDGSISCWGDNEWGQTSVPSLGTAKAVQIASYSNGSCAVLDDGSAKCWGDNANGQALVPDLGGKLIGFDLVPPAAPGAFTGVPSGPTKSSSAAIGFTLAEAGGTAECQLDLGEWAACATRAGLAGTFAAAGLTEGRHTFSVRQTDANGNIGTSATASWVVTAITRTAITSTTVRPHDFADLTVAKRASEWVGNRRVMSGTSDGVARSSKVDVVCLDPTSPGTVLATLSSGVPVGAGGVWSTTLSVADLPGAYCRLAALPYGLVPASSAAVARFAGPTVTVGTWRVADIYLGGSPTSAGNHFIHDYRLENRTGSSAYWGLRSPATCGLCETFTWNTAKTDRGPGLWDGGSSIDVAVGRLDSIEPEASLTVDGKQAFLPGHLVRDGIQLAWQAGAKSSTFSLSVNQANGDLTVAEKHPLTRCVQTLIFTHSVSAETCALIPTGITLVRRSTMSQNGLLWHVADTYQSTDARAHSVAAIYRDGTKTGSEATQFAYSPSGSFAAAVKGDKSAAAFTGMAANVALLTAAVSDSPTAPGWPRGDLLMTPKPSRVRVYNDAQAFWMSRFAMSVPKAKAVTIRKSYTQASTAKQLADLRKLALAGLSR